MAVVDDENILENMWLVARWASRRARAISASNACNQHGASVMLLIDARLRAALPG